MKYINLALLAGSALTTRAYAADKPVIAPAPAWVKAVAVPSVAAKPDDAPVHILLTDQQIDLQPGKQSVFTSIALKIQTPQGLSAGNISFPWRPDTDVLTVHKLLIRRGDQVIDVLASGQTFTVLRREQNLESAMLDGVLTANIQPEGLQVGDVVEFAATVTSSDPTLKGHVESIAAAWNGFPIDRAHLRAQWPSSLPVHLRQTKALPSLKPVKSGAETSVELTLENALPIIPPKGAPLRYRMPRLVELTDYGSWADLGALMAPLYAKAAQLPATGPLQTELKRIEALSPDPKVRAEAALALVQDRVRYVALAMGTGGYVPADAETTWSRRFGDCKAKTALLIALLHAMDIQADPVAVSTLFGDGMDARLPMVGMFNHVLVRAAIAGRTYWLDGTRTGDSSLDRLTIPGFGWGLPLIAQNAALVRMVPSPLEAPTQDVSIRIDASAGIATPALTHIETVMRSDDAIQANAGLANLYGEARDRALRDYWKGQYDFIEVKSATATFDAKTGEEKLVMDGTAKLDWSNGNYQTDGTNVGYHADFSRDPGPDRDAPFAVLYPYSVRMRESIVLPKGSGAITLGTGMEVDQKAGGIEYKRHAAIKDGVFTIEKTERSIVPEFPAKDAAAEQAALRMLADKPASLRMPSGYRYSGKDIEAVKADVPTTSSEYVTRAGVFANKNLGKEAIADYGKAIELDPNNVYAWANRALTRVQMGDIAGSKVDLAKSEALDPLFGQNFVGRGMIAEVEHRLPAAIEAYSKALERDPENRFAIERRAMAYAQALNFDRAYEDLTRLITKEPDNSRYYMVRGEVSSAFGQFDKAVGDFNHAVLLTPDNPTALASRGLVRAWMNDLDGASKDADAASKIDPKNEVAWQLRGFIAERNNKLAEAIAAYTVALQLNPKGGFSLERRAQANAAAGNDDAALADSAAALALNRDPVRLRITRANIWRRRGNMVEGMREAELMEAATPQSTFAHVGAANTFAAFNKSEDAMRAFDRALAVKPEAYIYLNRSLQRPKSAIAARLADLDAALKLEPDNIDVINAKANIQIEDKDFAGAIVILTQALKKAPNDSDLLAERGIAYARAGNASAADKDFVAARRLTTDPMTLNNRCWSKATQGVALEAALADCEAALKITPGNSMTLDSRGLALLRLGRFDDAITTYTEALAINPHMATSLLGRAMAWAARGDRAKANADASAADQAAPDVRKRFEGFGLKLSS